MLLVLLAFAAILVSLGSALVGLTREGGTASKRTLHALMWRIGLSIALFLFILFAAYKGWIAPHGLRG